MPEKINDNKGPLLTISLLSSGRPQTLWRCLDSVRQIMDRVPSELVIVDTGCTPEILARMQTYTDHIIPFTWCDDFSAARNVGLRAAKGAWFLYLDDDEWFTQVTPIIDFFLNGEYRNYDSACYYQRNYHDLEGNTWADAWVERMIDVSLCPSFFGIIHEQLGVAKPAIKGRKLVPATVDHYGYVFATREEEERHSQRNVTLLLKALEKEPENLHYLTQLIREYLPRSDHDALLPVCNRAMKAIGDRRDQQAQWDIGYLYHAQMVAYNERHEQSAFRQILDRALADSRLTDYYAADLYAGAVMFYYPLKDYETCRKMGRCYLEIYDRIGRDSEAQFEQGSAYLTAVFDEYHLNAVCTYSIAARLLLGDDTELMEYGHLLSTEERLYTTNVHILIPILSKWAETHPLGLDSQGILDYLCGYTEPLLIDARRFYTERAFEGNMEYLPEEIREIALFDRKMSKYRNK